VSSEAVRRPAAHAALERPLPPEARGEIVRVYVWQVPVRVTHWVIALSIFVLAFTGYFISNPPLTAPGPARDYFMMGRLRLVHSYTAILFSAAVLARGLWSLVGNRYSSWRIFLPVEAKRFKALLGTLGYYLFLLRKPPGFVGHNPLAGLVYFFVWLLYCTMILTGLAMLSATAPIDSYLRWFAFLQPLLGGLATIRYLHHVVMWLLLGFFAHHVFSSILMSNIEQNGTMESIFSGFKFVPREDLEKSGYPFVLHEEPPRRG
jgi:Ni/Fe-hydrogenase 1 B-type cytochrome subunit